MYEFKEGEFKNCAVSHIGDETVFEELQKIRNDPSIENNNSVESFDRLLRSSVCTMDSTVGGFQIAVCYEPNYNYFYYKERMYSVPNVTITDFKANEPVDIPISGIQDNSPYHEVLFHSLVIGMPACALHVSGYGLLFCPRFMLAKSPKNAEEADYCFQGIKINIESPIEFREFIQRQTGMILHGGFIWNNMLYDV